MKKIILNIVALALSILLSTAAAVAQSNPGLVFGQVPTAGQWNSYFAAKQDYLGFAPCLTSGCTLTGTLTTTPSVAGSAGFNVPPGTAPTAPNNGDIWTTSLGLFYRSGGLTYSANEINGRFISGNWYVPYETTALTTGTPAINTITCFYGNVIDPITIKSLGAQVTATGTGSFQLAIYSESTGTLTLVDKTGNLSQGSTGPVSGAVTNTTDVLVNGLYAFCFNVASTAGTYETISGASASTATARLYGSATQANVTSGTIITGRTVAQTFGTWPATISESTMADLTTNTQPLIAFQVN